MVNLPSDACELVRDIGGSVGAVEGVLVVVPVVPSVTYGCEAIGFELVHSEPVVCAIDGTIAV